jgi:diacylglycerol kinase family enzyme
MIAVIINPIAGGRRPALAQRLAAAARAELEARGEGGEVFLTERRGHARELARGALRRGSRLVMACGGDGTVNEVATELAFGTSALGIVPTGSGNGLARDLGIARRPQQALRDAFNAAPRRIDAGELNERLFFSIAGIGFDAHIAACFDRDAPRRGFGAYLRISMRELLTYEAGAYRINGTPPGLNGQQGGSDRPVNATPSPIAVGRGLLVTLANSSQFGNGARIAPMARLDDGKLDLVIFEEVSRFATLFSLPRLFTGRAAGARGISIQQIERATIESDRPMTFHVDGEPVADGQRIDVRVHPGALQVCVR